MAVSEERTSIGSFAVTAYVDVRLGGSLQGVPHPGQTVRDFMGYKGSRLFSNILKNKHALQIVAAAMASVCSVEMHCVGGSYRNS